MNKILLALGLVCAFSTAALANISGYQAKGKIVSALKASPKVTFKKGPWFTRLGGQAGDVSRDFDAMSSPKSAFVGIYAAGKINMKTGAVVVLKLKQIVTRE